MEQKKESGLVSVVIPTVPKRKKELQRALESVKNQTYKNIEIIVVDEGLPAPIQRNRGIKRSHGEFIAFLDDDDIWFPEKIDEQVALLNKKEFCDIGLCVTWILDKRFGTERVNKTPDIINHEYILNAFNLHSTSAYMVRKSHLKRYGDFDETLPSAQEYDLALRLSKHNPIISIPKVLVIQNETEGQISEDWAKKIKGILAIRKKHKKEYRFTHHIKAFGLVIVFTFGFIFGNRIYKILTLFKERYGYEN